MIVLCLCLDILSASDSLCSVDVFEKKCLCEKFTEETTSLPSSSADCNGLALDKFPDLTQFPNDLTILDLSMNGIQFLEGTGETTNNTLTKLILSYNIISDVSQDFFKGFSYLTLLDLSHNSLTALSATLLQGLTNLQYLDLSFNNIKELPSAIFEPLAQLQSLDLSYNPLGAYLFQSNVLSNITKVSINLTQLKLNSVGLRDLFAGFLDPYYKLTHLELQDNEFQYIPTIPYSLEHFDFSGNNITFVSAKFLNYHSLKGLRLSRMPNLTSIRHYAFYNLLSLETLILTDCPNIQEFTDLAFGLASKTMDIHPTTVNLARNGLTSLNSTYKHMFMKMKHIDLRHNPWVCDCKILWLQEFKDDLFKSRDLRCASPSNLRGKRIVELTPADLQDCYPEIYGKSAHKVTIIILMCAVICLMGLVFYLIRYPGSWLDMTHIRVGPNSPYSVAPQEDRF